MALDTPRVPRRAAGRELLALAAIVLVVAGALDGDYTLFEVIDAALGSTFARYLDLLFYVVPPHAALVVLAAVQFGGASRRRALETFACVVASVAALVHTAGLVRFIDGTPRVAWVFMMVIGLWSLIAIGGSIALAHGTRGARRSGYIIAAHVALFLPLSISYLRGADDHALFVVVYGLGVLGLIALAIIALRRGADAPGGDFGAVPVLVGRSLFAVLALLVTAAAAIWPLTDPVLLMMMDGPCELVCEPRMGPLWEAVSANECPREPHVLPTAVVIGVVEISVLAFWIWLGYRGCARKRAGTSPSVLDSTSTP